MVFRRKKSLADGSIQSEKNFWGGPMIDTIGQKWKIFNQWVNTIGPA